MRIAAIALFGWLSLIATTPQARACEDLSLTQAQSAAATELSADAAAGKKRPPPKVKKEKVEYMRSAAPPEPKK
jgi:hypothetical protein